MNKCGYKISLLSILLISTGCVVLGKPIANICHAENTLPDLIVKIASSKSVHDKLMLSDKLPESVIKKKDAGLCFDDKTISGLIDLLQDEEDGVRMNASIALGDVGWQAARAVPFLEKRLVKVNQPAGQIGPDLGSLSTIPRAIEKIRKSQRVHEHCKARN